MESMFAWVYEQPNEIKYQTVKIPDCADNQLLVKIDTACICNGSDPGILHGHPSYNFRHIFGHEPFGNVVKVGKDVSGYAVGDRITWWFSVGAFSEYAVITPDEITVLKLSDCISRIEAPIMELVIAAARAIRAEHIKDTTKILIVGLGPSGLVMGQRARALGAKQVVGWDLYPMRRETGYSLGFDDTFDPANDAFNATKAKYDSFDIVIDAMGDDILKEQMTFTQAICLAKQNGIVISYGHPENGRQFSPFYFQSKNLTMLPPENDMNCIRTIAQDTLAMIEQGKVQIKPLVSKIMPLYRADEALRLTMDFPDKYIKIILDCTDLEP